MKITIRVKTNSRCEEVRETTPGAYAVSVNAPRIGGKANERVVELLAEFFNKPKRAIAILHGHTGKSKVVEIV
ncbi:MAG TPA: DUF167 domain-containing protein [Bacteroidota bacterium]|nr:DUF167 domain-containing protein [Bacteroidota bacterium]